MGIHWTSLDDWVKEYEKKENEFLGIGKLRLEDEKLSRFRSENENLK